MTYHTTQMTLTCPSPVSPPLSPTAAVALALVAAAVASEAAPNALKEEQRTIFIDGGSTDSFGITDVFLYIGTFTLAILTALAIIGLIYGAQESGSTGYEAPATGSYT